MNKIKKLAISIIIAFLAILGICASSNAYYVGQSVDVTYDAYASNGNIYCVEHGQALKEHNYYTIISQVNIEGRKSTDYRGNTQDSWHNAKMAYILSSSDVEAVKNAIWNYMYTWLSNVGRYHSGVYLGFSNGVTGSPTYLDTESSNYANNFKDMEQIKDNTNYDKITVTPYMKDEKAYVRVGPFNWIFPGTMKNIEVNDQNDKKIDGVIYSRFKGGEEYWTNANGIASGKNFYVSVPMSTDLTKLTKITGEAETTVKGATIWFLESTEGYKQNLIIREPHSAPLKIKTPFKIDVPLLGNLKVIKVNEDNEQFPLANVGFIFEQTDLKKYLSQDSSGKITYVDKKEDAHEWRTNEYGEIMIEDIIIGNYMTYETENPNYGYEIKTEGTPKEVEAGEEASVLILGNKQIYVKLSGFVWKDIADSKTEDGKDRNDLFAEEDETNDILFDGIKVRLKDRRTGETVKETVTGLLSETHQGPPPEQSHYSDENGHNGHGEYLFMDVLIDELQNYYIEFEYDGLTYTNVVPYLDKDNGSKASESEKERDAFNKNFSKIEGKTRTEGVTIDGDGNEKFGLSYNIDEVNRVATLINNGQYTITANTDVTEFIIKDHFTYGQEEIKHINLGLYEREQPDLDIHKDIQNVRLTINGYEHTYNFAQRIVNSGEYEDGFNVGVKFGLDSSIPYTTAIYKSDYDYINENDKSRELKAYITYRIAITNKSSNLIAKVNSIVDYFDARYNIVGVGTKLNEDGTIANALNYTEDTAYKNDKFKKMIIYNDATIDNQQRNGDLYVQFALDRTAISAILEDRETSDDTVKLLDNVAEINSYSIYKDGKIYAGIDKNSAPGNAVPGNEPTYEDDAEKAPALKLEVANARQMAGKVFVDGTEAKLMSGLIREGNGQYDNGETPIGDVQITLTENSGTGKVYEAKTVSEDGTYGFNQDETTGKWTIEKVTDTNKKYEIKEDLKEGDFLIPNYIPGDYTLTYTWGNDTYTVQNYKGTIYKNQDRQNNKSWYKEDVDTRYSDALDNYDKEQDAPKGSRLQIDEEMTKVNKNTNTSFTRTQMDSTTPTMGITIENVANVAERITTSSYGDKLIYKVSNIDFGIVERARQQLALTKRIKTMKLTLANGQVISDITIDENGNVTGSQNNVTYMKPDKNMNPKNGYLRIELDNEMIQGAILQVGYSIVAENQSEVDYISSKYYNYGSQIKEEERGSMVTLTPSGIVDYLDKDWAFDENLNSKWKVKTLDELKEKVIEEVYNNEASTIEDKMILYTEGLANEKLPPVKPNNKAEIMLNVSKELSTAEDISLDNETEITDITKPGGSKMTTLLGNYVPGAQPKEVDEAMAETAIVTPPTGENQNYIIMITLGVTLLITLGSGIVVIKKKMFNKNK